MGGDSTRRRCEGPEVESFLLTFLGDSSSSSSSDSLKVGIDFVISSLRFRSSMVDRYAWETRKAQI